MSEETSITAAVTAGGNKLMGWVKGLGRRIFVHAAALIAGGTIAGNVAAAPLSAWSVMMSVYVGLVCIFARGMAMVPAWLVPAGFGVAQTAVLALSGFPLYQALFWGGVQAWVQRLFHKRLAMGTEWLVLLFIIPLSVKLYSLAPSLTVLLASLPVLAVLGVAVLRFLLRKPKVAIEEVSPRQAGLLEQYQTSIVSLRGKQPQLSRGLNVRVSAIIASAENILQCMAGDARDMEPGHRFMNRYLPAVHNVVDKHITLSREKVITQDMAVALDASEEMLARLDQAFAQENGNLLANDLTDYSDDLKVLDTLLKMDGR